MKLFYFLLPLCTGLFTSPLSYAQNKPATDKINIMLLGTAHFGQESFYKQSPSMDLFTPENQKAISAINDQLALYQPDLILIERESAEQPATDSLYQLFKNGKMKFSNLKYGRAEEYQFAYNLAKKFNLKHVYGADYYQSVSTRLFKEGKNVEQFTQGLDRYAAIGGVINQQLKEGKISVKDYLLKLNEPEMNQLTYYTLYVKPAVVMDGSFKGKVEDNTADTARMSKKYIGAEYISLLYGRELKIFSGILNLQQTIGGKRILVIMGNRHTAVLSKLFAEEPAYQVIPASAYLK